MKLINVSIMEIIKLKIKQHAIIKIIDGMIRIVIIIIRIINRTKRIMLIVFFTFFCTYKS